MRVLACGKGHPQEENGRTFFRRCRGYGWFRASTLELDGLGFKISFRHPLCVTLATYLTLQVLVLSNINQ